MGGKISLTSELGKGTSFHVTIPYEKVIKAPLEIPGKVLDEHILTGKRKVILVAEDVESNFKLIKYFLSGSDVEIIHAFNGKEAVDKYYANQDIDLILMDIKMPVMDGYTAVKLIREKNSKIPIIAQTAYADDREKAMEVGCSGFISKPFDKKSLYNILKEFI
jgi:CheY-like chemotaxis protein